MPTANPHAAIASYLTDMLAVEEHLRKALQAQISDLDDEPAITEVLSRTVAMCDEHIEAIQAMATAREYTGQGVAELIKRATAGVLGVGAGIIDRLRGEKPPKDLRDDYVALSLACIGYVMLYTTGRALDDAAVADLARRHLEHHVHCVMSVHNLIPATVIRELESNGFNTRRDVLAEIGTTIQSVWESEPGAAQTVGAHSHDARSTPV